MSGKIPDPFDMVRVERTHRVTGKHEEIQWPMYRSIGEMWCELNERQEAEWTYSLVHIPAAEEDAEEEEDDE